MKKKIITVIRTGLKKMDSVSQKIARNFKPDDIHLFRVEEKKSKAFLRLISTGMKNPDKLKLPK